MNEISKEQLLYMKRTRQHKQFVLFFQLFLFIFFIILWEITSRAGIINAFIFSSPSRMLASGKELLLNGQLLKHLEITLAETFASFFLVTAVSLFTAILLWWNNTLSEILEPYFVILNSLPKSAMAPIFIVWLGNNMKTIIVGVGCAMVLAPIFKTICDSLGTFIGWATNLQPFFMGIIISVIVGVVLTLPISSAAICAAVGISGGAVIAGVLDGSISMEVWNGLALAGGAATVGCCCNMLGFAVISYPDNGVGGLVAQGLGTSMLQVPNLMRKPVLWIPPVLTSAILGPVATCIFQLRNNGAAISSGMGTAGLVGPIGIITGWSNMPKEYAPGAFDWGGMILVCFILPVVLSWAIGKFMRKKGWIKEGDLKVDLG